MDRRGIIQYYVVNRTEKKENAGRVSAVTNREKYTGNYTGEVSTRKSLRSLSNG
jgi:hypothetical protein